jgi:predicted house-cleaning noncanonical NTP pyrophosphatase (MazG superfamily)
MIKTYNKLVRDFIPDIIEASGAKCETKMLTDEEYRKMLDLKLDEELAEYHKDQNIEELADLLELIYAATVARGYSIKELEETRKAKAETRGSFNKKIFLIKTIENN